MKSWLKDVVVPAGKIAFSAAIPLSVLWWVHTLRPSYSPDAGDARLRDETARIASVGLLVPLLAAGTLKKVLP